MEERRHLIGRSFTTSRPIREENVEATVENGSTNGDDSWKANSVHKDGIDDDDDDDDGDDNDDDDDDEDDDHDYN